MENGDDHHQSLGNTNNNGSSSSGSRWNPTKEQINMLESFYRQGLRTPSAEQIQQITARLRAYGHIEGKNVFYWFQNHKARQRQKQKQENLSYLNRFLHPIGPAFASYPNAVCTPYYLPPSKNDLSFYHPQYPKVQLPAAADFNNRRSSTMQAERYNKAMMHHRDDHLHESSVQKHINDYHHHNQETLDLFPIHPTGLLQSNNKNVNAQLQDSENENQNYYCYDDEGSTQLSENDASSPDGVVEQYPFFDFFCRK